MADFLHANGSVQCYAWKVARDRWYLMVVGPRMRAELRRRWKAREIAGFDVERKDVGWLAACLNCEHEDENNDSYHEAMRLLYAHLSEADHERGKVERVAVYQVRRRL